MIHYQLRCSQEHAFDGWFKDSSGFEAQAGRGLLSCPMCGDTKVNRALMAPAVPKRSAVVDVPEPQRGATQKGTTQEAATQQVAGAGLPDHLRALLQRLRAEVERTSDYVGAKFAEEARAIHRGNRANRSIYGESTPGQAEALAEEGIEVTRIPWVKRADG